MISRNVRESLRRDSERMADRHRGLPPAILRLAAHRVLETQVIHPYRLPCVESDDALQNEDGDLLYLEGYSAEDGPDVGAPGGGIGEDEEDDDEPGEGG